MKFIRVLSKLLTLSGTFPYLNQRTQTLNFSFTTVQGQREVRKLGVAHSFSKIYKKFEGNFWPFFLEKQEVYMYTPGTPSFSGPTT